MTNLRLPIFTLVLTLLFFSCSKDDGPENPTQQDVDPELLYGTWAIFQGELQGEVVDIPPTSPACGLDFFTISPDGTYRDYVFFDNNQCIPEVSELNWELRNGIITLRDQFGQSLTLNVVDLRSNIFIFTAEIDFDEDGTLDTFKFRARPYSPPAFDNVSVTFFPNFEARDRIEFTWDAYAGGDFSRYEVYRSTSCQKEDAELVGIIGEPETTTFIDESPVAGDQLCYFLRTYTADGLLGESDIQTVFPGDLEILPVAITDISASGNQINLSWEPFTGYYFAKYEIYVLNHEANSTGYAFQEEKIAEITDVGTTSFTDMDPPYLNNPIYEVRVVNTFDNNSTQFGRLSSEVSYQRPGLLPVSSIMKWTYDENEPTLYILGNDAQDNQQQLMRFNYETNQTLISGDSPDTSSAVFMKIVDSGFGKELLLQIGGDLWVYDAATLDFKYLLEPNTGFLFITDIAYRGNGVWLVADSDNLYSFTRTNNTLNPIAQEALSFNAQNAGQFQIITLGATKVLVGHEFASESYTFEVDAGGNFSNKQTFNTLRWKDFQRNYFYNAAQNVLLDNLERGIYETNNFSFLQFYDRPFLATGLSQDGNYILGTDNDPQWFIDENSLHERRATKFNRNTNTPEDVLTIGYPLIVFETSDNQTVCISSWFKREGIFGFAPKPDIFVEILE
ncbi:hypothetical protein SAMN04490243_1491 [Robiginitalea myxolifaciens]|uniref:Lipocalin-like domain-containing protein n=1 Tax=Robiginitalea myxolifaciens TaxID=400055 RepID=A0A1I6GAK5_9FLAO|nr:hypothetical protein [Robiginitalea myxolifaciens]SFR39199.1 hypothetical protein SAMN04490243_1491 [Robiginitalea myxolifaciens]